MRHSVETAAGHAYLAVEPWRPGRLERRVRKELQDGDNQAWLSPVSTWEALLLNAKGRIPLREGILVWVARAIAHLLEGPLTHEIVLAAQQLPLTHPDPAARFLAATAKKEKGARIGPSNGNSDMLRGNSSCLRGAVCRNS